MKNIVENFKSDALQSFRNYKELAERALAQVSDEDFFRQIDPESNSADMGVIRQTGGRVSPSWAGRMHAG